MVIDPSAAPGPDHDADMAAGTETDTDTDTEPSAAPGPDHDADVAAGTETEVARPCEPDAEAAPRPEPVAAGPEADRAARAETPVGADAVTGRGAPGVADGPPAEPEPAEPEPAEPEPAEPEPAEPEPAEPEPAEPEPAEPEPAEPEPAEPESAGPEPAERPVTEDRIVRVDLWATAIFTVVSVGAALWSGLLVPAVAVDIGLFVAGCGAFLYAYLRGIGRSRDDAISLAGLFFLMDGVAPRRVARALWLLLAAQVVVAVATAAARPFSSLAFGILAPMFGLALLALWGAVHGRFPPRVVPATRKDPDAGETGEVGDEETGEVGGEPTGDEA